MLRRNYPLRFLRSVWLGVNTRAMVIVRHSQQINCPHVFRTELLPRECNATKSDADKHCLRRPRTCYAPARQWRSGNALRHDVSGCIKTASICDFGAIKFINWRRRAALHCSAVSPFSISKLIVWSLFFSCDLFVEIKQLIRPQCCACGV